MTMHVTSRRVALAAACGLFAALPLSGAAQAITDTVFRYTNPKTGHFSIGVMAMAPASDTASYTVNWNGGSLFSAGDDCFNTGVNLPHAATMKRLIVRYTSGPNTDLIVFLRRYTLADGATHAFVAGNITDNSLTRKQKNIVLPNNSLLRVNNAQYAYGLGVCVGSDTGFHGARITYTYTHAGD
jgi:hypothetical protein